MRPPVLLRIALVALLAVTACTPAVNTTAHESGVVEQLFFGRNAGGRQVVSDSVWNDFMAEVVTPRFPGGLTFWTASGQWRRADGVIEREPSFVLMVEHAASAEADSSILFIIAAYKERFQQEAVLRIVIPVHVSF